MKNRVLAIILVISMILSLTGCKGEETTKPASDQVLVEGIVSEENLTLGLDGLELRLDPVNISEEANAKITKVSNAPKLDSESEIELEVYDFSIEGISEFAGVIELVIPMELPEGSSPGAAYLNETSGEWEPVAFSYDSENKRVVILTDHLSKYGVFSVTNEGKRRARVEFLGLYGDNVDEDFIGAVEEFSIGGVPANQCIDIGSSAAGDALQLGGDFLGNIVQSAGYLAYGEDVLSSLGDRLGSLGLLVSVVQIGNNLYNGKINDAVVGSMKVSYTYIMGKVVSKLSNSVLSASMASVAIVDYAINKFGTTAIAGRADIYRDAYSIYYWRGEDGYKTSADWFRELYPMFRDPTMSQDQLKAEIDKKVIAHCDEFWNANKLGVDYYVSEARERLAWTGGGAGLNSDLQKSISAEKRSIMYNEILPGVFYQIARKINLENEAKLRLEYKELTNYLNKAIRLSIIDSEKKYPNHQVKISPLNDKAVAENWSGKMNKDGELSTSFTLYGHMYAGSPNQILIFEPNANINEDEPIRIVDFKVISPLTQIDLGEEIPTVVEINGPWTSGSLTIVDFDLGPPPPPREEGAVEDEGLEGCDFGDIDVYNMVKAALEESKGVPIPITMDFQLDEQGVGIIKLLSEDDEDLSIEETILNAKYKDGDIEASIQEEGSDIEFTAKIRKAGDKIVLTGEFGVIEAERQIVSGLWNGVK